MNKIKGVFNFLLTAFVLLITAVPANGQDKEKKFPPLTSNFERVGIRLEVVSRVEAAQTAYPVIYTFKNKGKEKVKFLFTDRDILIYALIYTQLLETDDLTITLKPEETKALTIKTSKPPKTIPTNELILVWRESLGKWEEYGFGFSDTIYVPIVYDLNN